MGEVIRRQLLQAKFEGPVHEAVLNLIVAGTYVRGRLDQICLGHGITGGQYNVLCILKGVHPEGHPRREIARRLMDRAPDVTRLIDRLEREDLVERARSTSDQRLSITRITRKGLRLIEKLRPEIQADLRDLATRLSDRDAAELSRICEALYASDSGDPAS